MLMNTSKLQEWLTMPDVDEAIDDKDEVIDTKQPNGDDDLVVEMVEEEKDLCNDLECAMDKQYGT